MQCCRNKKRSCCALLLLRAGLYCAPSEERQAPLPPARFHIQPGARRPSESKVHNDESRSPRCSLIAFPLLWGGERGAASRLAPWPPCAAAPTVKHRFHCERKRGDPPRGSAQVHGLSTNPTHALLFLKIKCIFLIGCIQEQLRPAARMRTRHFPIQKETREDFLHESVFSRTLFIALDSENIWLNLTTHQVESQSFTRCYSMTVFQQHWICFSEVFTISRFLQVIDRCEARQQ